MNQREEVQAGAPGGVPVLDHAYDGIREYDNPLPGWWVWIFVASIVFTPLYWLYYHGTPGRLIQDEFDRDLAAWQEGEAKRAMESGAVTEDVLAALAHDAVTAAAGAALFKQNCAMCHGEKGEGKIGPNLTDDAWIHGKGTLVDIHATITNGVPEKGMIAWGKTLPPDDVKKLAAFVGTLRGTNVPGLAPQGTKTSK